MKKITEFAVLGNLQLLFPRAHGAGVSAALNVRAMCTWKKQLANRSSFSKYHAKRTLCGR
jgi:hypothetical protein